MAIRPNSPAGIPTTAATASTMRAVPLSSSTSGFGACSARTDLWVPDSAGPAGGAAGLADLSGSVSGRGFAGGT
jgi:hypothetical protein